MVAEQSPRKNCPVSLQETIAWLLRLGRPPLPENPIEAAKAGREPKSPCFFNGRRLVPISWKEWQKEQPSSEIYQAWFKHTSNGVGTLGGWNGKHWLGWVDIDQKNFPSADECNHAMEEWFTRYPVVAQAPCFQTPGGGYRILLAFSHEPKNFKANSGFCLDGGQHAAGEFLCKNGGHTLLPPTRGVNGNYYQWLRWSEYPPVLEKPEAAGIYPLGKTPVSSATVKTGSRGQDSLIDFLKEQIYSRLTLEGV